MDDLRMQEVYDMLSRASRRGYRDAYLISNSLLCKNLFGNRFLERLIAGSVPCPPSAWMAIRKLVWYYIKSALHFLLYLLRFLEWRFSGMRFERSGDLSELILIDTPFLMDHIQASAEFQDVFFPGLEDVLKKKDHSYAYAPFFYSSSYHKRPLEVISSGRILRKQGVRVISEYQLLTISDIAKLMRFVAVYPFHVLGYVRSLSSELYDEKVLAYELVDTLDGVTFHSYARYLFGRRLAMLPVKTLKLISWYENQPFNKQLYRGIRSRSQGTITIYGAQLFLYSARQLNLVPDEQEEAFGVLPDVILKNGPFYLPDDTRLTYRIGPSLRYDDLLRLDLCRGSARNDLLVLLPYYDEDVRGILNMLRTADLGSYSFLMKAHPASPLRRFMDLVPKNARIVDGPVSKQFASAKILIGAASGTLVEAASAGIPVIAVKSNKPIEFNNPLPSLGKGLIWEEVDSPEGLRTQVMRFERLLADRPAEIIEIAQRYREALFCMPTEECIAKSFEL